MTVSMEWHGPQIEETLQRHGRDGLAKAGELLLQASRQVVPLEEGTLERSGAVTADGDRVHISYGTPYAVYQHERMDLRHDPGRTAKYLENPAHEQSDAMLALVAAEIRRALGS